MEKRSALIFTAIVISLLAFSRAEAREAPRKFGVGILIGQSGTSETQTIKGIQDGLKDLRYKEGQHVVFETKDAKGDRAALKPAAAEMVKKKMDVIFTIGTRATLAAMESTKEIPIVFRHAADPVKMGFVKSMKRPGGNVTGVASFSTEMTEKRMQILKQIVPKLTRVHVFYDSNNPFARENFALARQAAQKLRLEVAEHAVKTQDELKASLNQLQQREGDAIFHVSDDLVESLAELIFDTARQKALPTMFEGADWAINGSLLSYGANYYQMGRQAASLMDRIFRGKKPGDLPVERAAKFDLLINYRMATAIGLNIPPEVLKKADKVIR